jgi:hypothetical protein
MPSEGALLLQGLLVPKEVASQVHEEGDKAYRVKKTGLDRREQLVLPAFNACLQAMLDFKHSLLACPEAPPCVQA